MVGRLLGSSGIGLVWGWLVAGIVWNPLRLKYSTWLAIALATLITAATIFLFTNLNGVIVFGITTVIALWIRVAWLNLLQDNLKSSALN